MLKKPTFKYFLLFLGLIGLVQCSRLEDAQNENYQAEWAVPIINDKVKLSDLFTIEQDTALQIEPDGFMKLVYPSPVTIISVKDLFSFIPDLPFIPLTDTLVSLPIPSSNGFTPTRLDLNGGQLGYNIFNSAGEDIELSVFFLNIFDKNNKILSISSTVKAAQNFSGTVDLTSYSIKSSSGLIAVRYIAKKANGERIKLTLPLLSLKTVGIAYAEGYLEKQAIDLPSTTIGVQFLDTWKAGNVYFAQPKLNFFIENSLGVPLFAQPNFVYLSNGTNTFPVQSGDLFKGINVNYPNFSEKGKTKTTTFVLDEKNSNLPDILSKFPNILKYDVDVIANPNQSKELFFVTDTSKIKAYSTFEIPLYVKIADFQLKHTLGIDLKSLEQVKKAEFKVIINNNLPLDAAFQAYFMDNDNNTLDSLFASPQLIAQAAPIDQNGNSQSSISKTTFIPIDEAKINRIKSAKTLLLKAISYTTDKGEKLVRANDKQFAEVKIGLKIVLQ